MSLLQDVKAARWLISDPDRWTRRCTVADADGLPITGESSPDAARWCAAGAACAVTGLGEAHAIWDLLDAASPGGRVSIVNDQRGHAAVLEVYDAVIAGLEDEAASNQPDLGPEEDQ